MSTDPTCAAGCGLPVHPDDMQEMTGGGPAHVLCLLDGDDDDE